MVRVRIYQQVSFCAWKNALECFLRIKKTRLKHITTPSPKGRPKQSASKTQAKQDRIIEAAKTLFDLHGYEAVSMRKVAAEAGIGAMTIYNYFDSKSALLHHIWQSFFDELYELMIEAGQHSTSPRDAIYQICHCYLKYWQNNPEKFRVVFLNEDRADDNNRFFVDHANIDERMQEVFTLPFANALPEKSETELEESIHASVCMLNGICLNIITISEFDWQAPEKMLDIYLNGLFREA